MKKIILLFTVILSAGLLESCEAPTEEMENQYQADVLVYGGTAAAVMAAVQVKRMGKSVIVVSPDRHLGGLSAGGLGWTDTGNKSVIGGLARQFYHKIYEHYQDSAAWKWQSASEYGERGQGTRAIDGKERTMWIFEPSVAEAAFEGFIKEHEIELYRDEWLDREDGVIKEGTTIKKVTTLSGKQFTAQQFIDATYEGDLMAAAGVSYHVGREANSVYGEEWNGIQTGVLHHDHYFKKPTDPYIEKGNPESGVLPRVSVESPGEYGAGDKRIQAYCFRMCLSNHPDNRIPFPKPAEYDPSQYELLVRVFESGWDELFRKFDPVPNRKTDTNNHGPFSTDNIGMNYDYPDASYERRQEIIAEHEQYQKGLMYFLANDPRIPEQYQTQLNEWGLAKDEFQDNGNWPHQLYIREARRMIGTSVMTEHEVMGKRAVPQSVGMGSYTMDSHNVQRYIKADGYVQNEGDLGVRPKQPYQIQLGSLLPKAEECTNLTVPICVSSSHIAFGSIRMEPVFMILGQSAATVAVQAINEKSSVQAVPYEQIRERLATDGQILAFSNAIKPTE